VHPGIVADQQQPLRIACGGVVDDVQQRREGTWLTLGGGAAPFMISHAISQVCTERAAGETLTASGNGGCAAIQPPISAASALPRSSRRRSWSLPPGASFSVLA